MSSAKEGTHIERCKTGRGTVIHAFRAEKRRRLEAFINVHLDHTSEVIPKKTYSQMPSHIRYAGKTDAEKMSQKNKNPSENKR